MSDPGVLIDKCYAAVLDSGRWTSLMSDIGEFLDATGTAIISHDPTRTSSTLHSESLAAADSDFKNYWWRYESRISRSKPLKLAPGSVITDPMIFTNEERARDPYFQEFCRAHEMDEIAAYFANDPLGGAMTVSLFRRRKYGSFERRQVERLKIVGPHVARAFQLTVELNLARCAGVDLQAGLDDLGIGAILLDEGGRVRSANEAAQEMAAGCLSIVRGASVRAVATNDQRAFGQMIAQALPGGIARANTSAVLRASDGTPHLHCEVLPIRLHDPFLEKIGAGRGGALLIVRSLRPSTSDLTIKHLLQLGLTQAEAAVAVQIGRGRSPKEVAEQSAVSPATVRFQLRSVFSKLSVRRQSELAVIVTRLDAMSHASSARREARALPSRV